MVKSIKKSIKYFIIIFAVVILLPLAFFIILRSSSVQTYVVKGITKYISRELNTTISVGSVKFRFFNRLSINDLLIKDLNYDTLIYTPSITAGLRRLDRKKGIIRLSNIVTTKPVIAFITDSTGTMNLSWYLDMFKKPRDTSKSVNTALYINHIEVKDGRFSLKNKNNLPSKTLIDFNNLALDHVNGVVNNLAVQNDSLTMEINNLDFHELHGFQLKKMTSKLLINQQKLIFTDATIESDSSVIVADRVGILADSAGSFKRFLQEVRLDINLRKSLISSSDLKYFLPFMEGYDESFWFSGNVAGTISELRGRKIMLTYKDNTNLDCEFDLSGLPDIKNTFVFLEINDFRSTSNDIEQIDIPGKGKIMLPETLRKLGVISFSGTFTGFSTDFVAYGKIITGKGVISTDISLRPEKAKRFRIKGLLKGTGIDLGTLSGNEEVFGNLSIETNVDGYTDSFNKIAVNLTGKIDSLDINRYIYRNIGLNGYFTDKAWDGNIEVNDDNIKMDLLGRFDFNKELPEFDFTLNLEKADLYHLNLDKSDTSSAMSLLMTANFKGNTIDNLDGEIKLLNSSFTKFNNNIELYDFSLKTFSENKKPVISLRTDFIDADLNGFYNFAGLKNVVKSTLAAVIPSKYGKEPLTVSSDKNNFIFDIKFKNTDKLNRFLRTDILLSENSLVHGSVFQDSLIYIAGNSKSLSINNIIFKDISFDARYSDSLLKVSLNSGSFDLSGLSELANLNFNLNMNQNKFYTGLKWDNKEKLASKGSFESTGSFNEVPGRAGRTVLDVNILPGEVLVRDSIWKINPAEIIVDSNSVQITRFNINQGENHFLVEGKASYNPEDTLYLEFSGINLNPINNLYEKGSGNDANMLHLALGGILDGKVSLTNMFKNFMFESDISIEDFTLLDSQYGEIRIGSIWNNDKNVVEITVNNNLDGVKLFDINGDYDPGTGQVNLTAETDKMPVGILNPLLNFFASDIGGTATGKVNLTGKFSEPVVTGALMGENITMKIDYLQSKYRFNDSIRFDKTGIKFNNIQLFDERGNTAFLNGAVTHKYFKDYGVDLTIRTNDCMVLNTKSKDNDMFYGTAFASGVTSIKTIGSVLRFDISASTGRNTKFYIPLNTGMSVSENSFISFVGPSKENEAEGSVIKNVQNQNSSSALEIAFDLDVTPDAEVQLIMDPKIGDIMKGTGTGNLNISLDRKGVFKIFGDYTIEDGDYLFTLGNIINKSFNVENGGKISFNGDVENADIDIKAIYKTKASLYDIMPGMLPESKQNERIPVECQLLLSGKLFNPVVGFDINLPTADEETRAYLKSMIKSDEDMSRQFLFLLVMNSFYADPNAGTQQSTASMGSATVGVTTMEMVSNQLSNWLSQISNDFDIGVVYRPGSTALPNSQELQVALSTQLLNDKVVINGNFDVAGNQAGTQRPGATSGSNSITGAFDIEYKINEKIRFKFFNRSNDNFYIDNGIQYTQGIGLFFRQDFNKLRDLFRKTDKGDMKKEDEPKAKKKQ